jgi:pyruvate kinase
MNTLKPTHSKTKMIATIGPASSDKDTLKKFILEGVDVCRLNFSHGTHQDHHNVIRNIREINKELGLNIALLADLQGPKIRIGQVENNQIILEEGQELEITTNECIGTHEKIYLKYENFPCDVVSGETILIDDGKLKLQVLETNNKDSVRTKVIYGGVLSSKKGVNLPGTNISIPSLTDKDKEDARFALENDVDWIALSFVRNATDVIELKQIIKKQKKHASVISKIEKPEALKDIVNIIDVSDGIMVARGDLGVELDFHKVPVIQKDLVVRCINASKPVIIATQMLESMIQNFRPTRAEANDVANAVIDGADTLMLSGETSVGKYPAEAISAMHHIIEWTEKTAYKYLRGLKPDDHDKSVLANSVCYNAAKMAEQAKAKAIITFTHSGFTAYKISGYRPPADIYVFTSNKALIPKMSLLWGVKAYYFDKYDDIDDAIEYTVTHLKNIGELTDNCNVIHVGSIPLQEKGRTNMMKISYI